jgi:hypothetical protein
VDTLMEECPVADKPKRRYAVAKIDVEALAVAKKVAALKGMTLAEYISAIVLPVASRELQAEAKKINRPGKGDVPSDY